MTSKVWSIDSMESYPEHKGQKNVVFLINWRLNGTDGPYRVYKASSIAVEYKEGDPYTPYDQLTEDLVVSWVKDTMGPEAVLANEADIDEQLANLATPKSIILPNPWVS